MFELNWAVWRMNFGPVEYYLRESLRTIFQLLTVELYPLYFLWY